MNDRVTFVVMAESLADGSLVLVMQAVEGSAGLSLVRSTFKLAIWREDPETVRISLRNPTTGSIGYVQGSAALIDFARELGLVG